jgi:cytochrome oxidase assembly protein ShyY1
MRRRIPVVATVVVLVAIAAMIWLGLWQLRRLHWKEALIARYAAAANRPPIPFPDRYPVSDDVLFRRATAQCSRVAGWAVEAGRTRSGMPGWRHIARCVAGAGQVPVMADLGVSDRPSTPSWPGGAVSGPIAWAPSHESLLARIWSGEARRDPMIVAEQPAPGLEASEPPSVADIPNNHLSYAVQWFLFAATAAVIYALALRRRMIADRTGGR